jgi:hypothetical protein
LGKTSTGKAESAANVIDPAMPGWRLNTVSRIVASVPLATPVWYVKSPLAQPVRPA